MRITLSIRFLLLAGAAACAFNATAAAGDADPSFGGAGYVRYAAPTPTSSCATIEATDRLMRVAAATERRSSPD